MAQKPRKPLTHKISDNPSNRDALEQARSAINDANRHFRRVINGTLVTEAEYIEWRDNGGELGNR